MSSTETVTQTNVDARDKFICFVHIEKSGGITLHKILHRNLWSVVFEKAGLAFHDFRRSSMHPTDFLSNNEVLHYPSILR